ncbi:tRNA guanosine(34) transglycosylase Tgt [Candidatus Hepatobacter penaei]|uniref:tRNA guanosine(34) transglycosylase Tgt n=1 Tax=Candidatus Hepatobacter penaei TaxID=1274402 RepID=UPI0004F3DAF3|nr:tRNA guanosine(34) transglycosylase Tgt [Candidatus Hepatobacter penaei]TGW15925.1 tRNA guanosine(34) transglycosylase Tgt [bacterium NHP-B]
MDLYPHFRFDITHQSTKSGARVGTLTTPHGTLSTPAFIFCATKASLKGVSTAALREAGVPIILSNTYHLMLQPGAELIQRLGGLHKFMNWSGPLLTDSGGFQIFSLGHGHVTDEIKGRARAPKKNCLRICEDGVTFTSYRDGQKHHLTPEKSIDIQQKLGADLIVSFDECTPYHVSEAYTEKSMRLSTRWGKRCLDFFTQHNHHTQALYSVIQGGIYPHLRQESADFANQHAFFGHAIGGSLGASTAQMNEVVDMTTSYLDKKRPIHLLGIGKLHDIETHIQRGIDTFDCVHPTRLARHGGALMCPHTHGKDHLNIKNAQYRTDDTPLDKQCPCPTCKHYSRAYLHHLFKAGEILGPIALTQHNVAFMVSWMERLKGEILANRI